MTEIYLNVYDMTSLNSVLKYAGLGVYHSGVQVGEYEEYIFGANNSSSSSGVSMSYPRDEQRRYVFKESIFMGKCYLPREEIDAIIRDLELDFSDSSYDIFDKNCNHFSNQLCMKLVSSTIPSYIFNISNCFKSIRCIVSSKIVKQAFKDSPTKKNSLYLGKKRIECKKTRDFEMSLLSASTLD